MKGSFNCPTILDEDPVGGGDDFKLKHAGMLVGNFFNDP